MRLGIMGGTFDPIHFGHLFIAEEARYRFQLDHVLFVTNGTPPHKSEEDLTPAFHRHAMAIRATRGNPYFTCSAMELNRAGPSYTIDTLAVLREDNPDAEFFYICGVDAVAEITTWHRHEEIMQHATFIAATRPGFDLRSLKEKMPVSYLEKILLLGSTTIGISSSEIRERLAHGVPVRYLLPDVVLDYISDSGLYNTQARKSRRNLGAAARPAPLTEAPATDAEGQ